MYSNPALIRLRSILRSAGILRWIQANPLYVRISQGYESRFDAAMMASLQPGMCVFDIGANVGYYTEKFAERVGPAGHVHAFEPVPASAARVRELIPRYPCIQVHESAIADQPGEVVMSTGPDSTAPTNRIAIGSVDEHQGISVAVSTLDQAAREFGMPDAIKIDVEGYEWHVLVGGSEILESPRLKHVFLEIHFGLLEQRGLRQAAAQIQQVLEKKGFQVTYTDFSHLHARRYG